MLGFPSGYHGSHPAAGGGNRACATSLLPRRAGRLGDRLQGGLGRTRADTRKLDSQYCKLGWPGKKDGREHQSKAGSKQCQGC